jgi:hypothetical protein
LQNSISSQTLSTISLLSKIPNNISYVYSSKSNFSYNDKKSSFNLKQSLITPYNKIELEINRIKTTYGKNNPNYFDNMVKSGNLIEVYNKKRSTKLPIQSGNFNTSTANNVPQSNTKVNNNTSSTKYSMQDTKNDAQELDNSSFLKVKI